MASNLSSEGTETIGVLDEKEEGEISLEDVSSSEEGHLNYGYGTRVSQCSNCLSSQHNASWCTAPAKIYPSKSCNRRDAVQGKENRHQIKESGCIGTKHIASTLQEKNDDLVSISSDSDMEIVGLADNSKQIIIHSSIKNRVKKKRTHAAVISMDDVVSSSTVDLLMTECVNTLKHDVAKNTCRPHHRDISPVHGSSRSRIIPRTPPRRHRSFMRAHYPFKRSKSPVIHNRSRTIRRSPRRLKSPKRSPYRSSTKAMPRKTSHLELSPPNYVNTHKLLKKVRQLDSTGFHSLKETLHKNKEHASSLKEKLTNMMKVVCDNNSDIISSSKEKSTAHVNNNVLNDADDEEDLALLRQKALETKQNKSNKQNDQPKTETARKVNVNINDDQDEEDLELRMIALRSAVLKKHQNRVQKGMKSGKSKKSNTSRSESPFTQSFLDSIPIPGEELLNFASPPHTPLPINENNHTEDMEIDTDVEREKEKLPYSPTDKITTSISIDTEMLGIQPSDVSFIRLNEANNSPNCKTSIISSQDDQKPYQGKIVENRSYLPNIVYYTPSQNPLCPTNANMQYLSANSAETSKPDFMKVHNSHADMYQNECNIDKSNTTSEFVDINSSQEIPYSPTDTPVYDPDLSHALPQTLGPLTTSNSSLVSLESYASNAYGNSEQFSQESMLQHTQTKKQTNNINTDEQLNKSETLSLDPIVGSATTSLMESVSPSSSMITIDDLLETDADASPLTDPLRNTKCAENIPNDSSNNIKETISEPLYMKGIPDVTKDINKIPTLINKTLVPAPILKTNKQLQLPLPTRKVAVQEPTFKSAKMQPVNINEESNIKMNASFKPIKLQSIPQKSHSVLDCTAFHEFLHEDTTNKVSTNETDTLVADNDHSLTLVQNNTSPKSSDKTCDIKSPTQKKKKLLKKGLKRKNSEKILMLAKKHDSSCTKSDNINTVDKKIHKTDGKGDTEEVQKEMDTRESINSSISKALEEKISSDTNKDVPSDDALKGTEDRRQSLDEDEEALRAILLASLPKRSKTTNNLSNSTLNATEPTVSNQVLVHKTSSTNVTSTVSTIITTNTDIAPTTTDVATLLPKPHTNSYGSENDKNQTNAEKKINPVTQGDLSVRNVKTLNSATSGRKRSVPIMKGPQKKLVKRISIPASTKVVNNAKKYQNAMIQKKLNLQKATLYNKQKIIENKVISKVQSNDSKWSANAKTLSDTQRIVINLESDTESDSESERQKSTAIPPANSVTAEKHQPPVNSTAEFEKNLEQFLRAVRKKQESMAAARPTSILQTAKKDAVLPTKPDKSNSSNLHTPLAVRHLPASQQEEYHRLKQQILEREKLKLHRSIETNNLTKSKSVEAPSKPTLPSSPNKESLVKVNQTTLTKSQNAQQLNKENCSKNLVDSTKSTSTLSANVQSSTNKIHNVDKQGNTSPNQTKVIPRHVTNPNILAPTENNPNNVENETTGNSTQSTNASQKVFESPTLKVPTKLSPSLKILSTDEVNEKYIQVQIINDTNKRMVTIKDKVALSSKTVINRNESVSGSKNDNNKDICDHDINQVLQTAEKDVITNDSPSGNNDVIDSDASTVILSRGSQSTEGKESTDTSESTIRLSQYEEDKKSSLHSNAENREDVHFLLFKNNTSPKGTKSIEENWEALKKYVKTELNTLINLSRAEQEQRLMETEQKLVLKRYTILDDLAEMSGNLRQWHMERDLQTNLAAEVKKLREQLKVAEERLQVQRNRINSIGPKVVAAHGKINAGRQECFKLATICSTLGSSIVGAEYKVPEAGAQLLDSRLKEVASHTRQLSRKKVPSIDISETYESRLEEDTVSTVCTEVSDTTDLLEECSIDNLDTTILNKSEFLIKSNETEETEEPVQIDVTTVNVNEGSKDDSMVLNNSVPSNNERSISDENNIKQEVFTTETNLGNTSVVVTDNLNSENAQDLNNKEVTNSNVVVRPATLEPVSKKRNCTKPEGEFHTKKTLLPYESVLTYFRVPRNTNPNGILCPYELMGTCSDGDCQFVHQTESQAK